MGKKLLVFNVLVAVLALPVTAQTSSRNPSTQQQIEELRDRLEDLEQRQQDGFLRSTDSSHTVRPFLNHVIYLGGYFESGLTSFDGPDTNGQTSANTNTLGINLAADLTSNIRFVSQILTGLNYRLENPHNDPRVSPSSREYGSFIFGAVVAQAYAAYEVSPMLNVQAGLGYVPFGHAFQQREPVLFLRRGGPQMLATSSAESVGIAHPLWMGVHLFGSFEGREMFGYNLYTHSPLTNTNTLGAGGRLWHRLSETARYGYSIQTGRQDAGNYISQGVDLQLERGALSTTFEFAHNTITDGEEVATSFYVEPSYALAEGEHIAFLVADYVQNHTNSSNVNDVTTPDPYEKWAYGVGWNWLPVPFARYRATLLAHDYIGDSARPNGQDRDYYSFDLSIGVAF